MDSSVLQTEDLAPKTEDLAPKIDSSVSQTEDLNVSA